jgi:hypothetical protein
MDLALQMAEVVVPRKCRKPEETGDEIHVVDVAIHRSLPYTEGSAFRSSA